MRWVGAPSRGSLAVVAGSMGRRNDCLFGNVTLAGEGEGGKVLGVEEDGVVGGVHGRIGFPLSLSGSSCFAGMCMKRGHREGKEGWDTACAEWNRGEEEKVVAVKKSSSIPPSSLGPFDLETGSWGGGDFFHSPSFLRGVAACCFRWVYIRREPLYLQEVGHCGGEGELILRWERFWFVMPVHIMCWQSRRFRSRKEGRRGEYEGAVKQGSF